MNGRLRGGEGLAAGCWLEVGRIVFFERIRDSVGEAILSREEELWPD
jgi:hypothetical protein